MKFKNILSSSLFLKSIRLAKSNPGKIGLMVLFDVSFFVSFYYVFPLLARYLAENINPPQTLFFLILSFVLSALYALLVLFFYSFFKYGVLDFINSLFAKSEFLFARLWKFYILNIILFIPIFALFSILLGSIKEAYKPYFFVVIGLSLSILLYIILNISHSLFYNGASLKDSIIKGFSIAFTRIKIYMEIILTLMLAALILSILFLGAGYLISFLGSKNYFLYLKLYAYFTSATFIITYLVLYFVILINRISFYNLANKLLREHK